MNRRQEADAYEKKFHDLYNAIKNEEKSVKFYFSENYEEKLQHRINQMQTRNVGDVRKTSQFIRSLERVDDLFVATDFAVQQYEKSLKVSRPSSATVAQPTSHKRDKAEMVDVTTEDDASLPNKRAKKQPFQSAKDRYKQEGGKLESSDEKSSNDSSRLKRDDSLPAQLSGYDKSLVEKIEAEIIHHGQPVRFDDISGLSFAKKAVQELICWPMKAPELFTGLRSLPRGILLFGPPGTGKTLIGKAIAHQSGATFFSISASSLMSKWIGEGEKTVRTLFAVANYRQPSVVFIDEVDSLLTQRSSDENEATRRMKTEFMVQLDGASTNSNSRVVILGATNRPEELDEAVRRRFVKRLYIPLPDAESRKELFCTLLKEENHELTESDIGDIVLRTEGFSGPQLPIFFLLNDSFLKGADIRSLCTEAAMGPLRELMAERKGNLLSVSKQDLLPITVSHFIEAFDSVKPSVSQKDLKRYIDWNNTYGSYRFTENEVNILSPIK